MSYILIIHPDKNPPTAETFTVTDESKIVAVITILNDTAQPEPAPIAAAKLISKFRFTGFVNLRAGPGSNYPIRGSVNSGYTAELITTKTIPGHTHPWGQLGRIWDSAGVLYHQFTDPPWAYLSRSKPYP